MIPAMFFVITSFLQEDVPFKAKEDFEIKLDLSFKQRSSFETGAVLRSDKTHPENERTGTTSLPYLVLNIKILKVQPGETRMKVIRDDKVGIMSKKIGGETEFKLSLGFTDDIKDRISGYKHVIHFLSSRKDELSRIVIEFDEDGNYFVNGEKRGRI